MGLGGSEEKEKRGRKWSLLRRNTGAVGNSESHFIGFLSSDFIETSSPRVPLFRDKRDPK
jgi:hypothetical protein